MKKYETRKPSTELGYGFELEGKEFPCLDLPPIGSWKDIGELLVTPKAVIEFVRGAIATEEKAQEFDELILSKDIIIDIEVLRDIATDLASGYAERPTGRPSSSSGGPNSAKATSKEGSSTKA